MSIPTQSNEVAFISGVTANGILPLYSFASWNDGTNPADYSGGYTSSAKFGANTAPSPGGTVQYYFDPGSAWTPMEQQLFVADLALWSDIANISFVPAASAAQAQIVIKRASDGSAQTSSTYINTAGAGITGGSILLGLRTSTVSIDTSVSGFGPITSSISTDGGYPYMTALHELGHAIGLGHAGPYNTNVDVTTQQFSPYDMRLWSIMSYIDPWQNTAKYDGQYPVTGTNWGYTTTGQYRYRNEPVTWMPLDILAAQSLYGVPTSTPLSGGQTFGFHCNIAGPSELFFDFTKDTTPVITIWDDGSGNTLDLSGFSAPSTVNLNAGTFSSVDGLTNNVAIAFNTAIDTAVLGSGSNWVTCNNDGDTVYGGAGNDTITGGGGVDWISPGTGTNTINGGSNVNTVLLSGSSSLYSVTQTSPGDFTVIGSGTTDMLSNVQYLKFSDSTVHLLPGPGTAVNFNSAPSTYMGAIRDFGGNNLGGATGWALIGTADTNGSGTVEHIFVNSQIGRWAEVATESNGLTYFDNYGWAGDTRVEGIYIDPLVASGAVQAGSASDSEHRFQNDLLIGNIKGILGEGDYNHDGLQEVYFSLTDGTAYLHAYMHADGNIQYANYQSQQQVIDYLTSNGWGASTWTGWFPSGEIAPTTTSSAGQMAPAPMTTASLQTGTTGWTLATGTG